MGTLTRSRTMMTSRSLLFSVLFVLLGLLSRWLRRWKIASRGQIGSLVFAHVRPPPQQAVLLTVWLRPAVIFLEVSWANKAKISCIYKGHCCQKLAFLMIW